MGHVARMGVKKNAHRILAKTLPKEKNHLEDIGVNGRIL
jgi:hypothetical protein